MEECPLREINRSPEYRAARHAEHGKPSEKEALPTFNKPYQRPSCAGRTGGFSRTSNYRKEQHDARRSPKTVEPIIRIIGGVRGGGRVK